MKYFILLGIFFVHSSLCMEKLKLLKDRYSPKSVRKKETPWTVGSENGKEKYTHVDNKMKSYSLALDLWVIEQTNEAQVVRFEKSKDLYDFIELLEKKLNKEIDSKKKDEIKQRHLAMLKAILQRIQGDIATLSPREIAFLMAYLSYIPQKTQPRSIIPHLDCDTSSTVCIVVDQECKRFSGAFAECINGLHGVGNLYKDRGLLYLANGTWYKKDNSAAVIFDTIDTNYIEKLHKMSHHPFLENVENGFPYTQ